jgi:hypothetical protein
MRLRIFSSTENLQKQDHEIVWRITGPYGLMDDFFKYKTMRFSIFSTTENLQKQDHDTVSGVTGPYGLIDDFLNMRP